MIDPRRLALLLSVCACTPSAGDAGDAAPSQRDEQVPPAAVEPSATAAVEPPGPAAHEQPPEPPPPCSVAGMLARDSPITAFEYRCPRTLLPPEGEIARCIADSIAAERPFLTELVMPEPSPPHQQPLLVGAIFDGRYEVRMYQPGERIKLAFEPLEPDGSLPFSVHPTRVRCEQSPDLPKRPPADQWRTLGDDPGHRFAPDACLEWFDPRERVPRFDAKVSLVCTAHAPTPEPEPEPEPAKVEVDPASASACEAGDGPACVAAALSVAPTGAYRVVLSKDEADRRERETARYAGLGCGLDQARGCALAAHFGPWRDRDGPLARGCELGDACSCAHLGESLTTIGRPQDAFERGVELLEQACVAGHRDDRRAPDSSLAHAPGKLCDRLASLYERGRESMLEPSATAAAKHRRLACEQGYVLGCACERDEDCGGAPYYCLDSSCTQPSDCAPDPEDADAP